MNLDSLSFPNNGGLLFGAKAHFVDGALGADAVDDTDQSVRNGDEDKEEVLIGANRDNHEGKDEVDEVEDGKGVRQDDFADGVLVFGGGAVDATICLTFFDLFFGEAS